MAWTEKLPNGKLRVGYRDADGKRHRLPGSYPDDKKGRAAAEAAGTIAENKSRQLSWRNPDRSRIKWGEWAETWWVNRTVEPATLKREQSMRDQHLDPKWAEVPLGRIRKNDVRVWAGELARKTAGKKQTTLQPASVQRILNVFRSSLSAAVDAGILDVNPADRVRVTVGQKDLRRYLTREEARALLAEFKDVDLAMVSTLLYCGLRWGEMAGLQSRRVKPDKSGLRVAEVWDTSARTLKAYPKGRSVRDVPIPAHLRPLLSLSAPMVFSKPNEPVPDYSNWRQHIWLPAVKRADIGPTKIHDLRHTFASWLLQAGIPLAEVGKLLGHADPSTTQIYAHLGDSPTEHILAALPDISVGQKVGQTVTSDTTI